MCASISILIYALAFVVHGLRKWLM